MKKHLLVLLALLYSGFCVSAQTLTNYQATVKGQSPNYYFTFDGGSLTDSTGHGVTLTALPAGNPYAQAGYDIFHNPSNTVYFALKTDALSDPNESTDMIINGGGTATTDSTATGSLSFLFKSLDPGVNTAQKFIFSAGITTSSHNSLSLLVNNTNVSLGSATNSLQLRFGDGTTTLLPFTNIVPNTWYYFAFTYTEATNGYFFDSTGINLVTIKGKWYLGVPGGTLASGVTTNAIDAVAGEGTFRIGNKTSADTGFANPGAGNVDEFATWSRRLSDAEVQAQFAKLPTVAVPPRSAYEGTISAQSPAYYFKMNGNFVDSVGGTLTLQANTTNTAGAGSTLDFTYDYFGGPTNAVTFATGGDSLTNNGNLLNGGGTYTGALGTGKGAISFLFRTMTSWTNQGNRYVYTAGGDSGVNNRFELWFNTWSSSSYPFALKLGFGNSSTAILNTNQFVPSAWYYFAMTYDETLSNNQVKWWLGLLGGGTPALTSGTLSAVAGSLAGQGNLFIVGDSTNILNNSFRDSKSGQGRIENFAIWHQLLTAAQITNQFNALFVSPAPPKLSIARSGANAIISWPSDADPGYLLQTNSVLTSSGTWANAGTPAVAGSEYVVTNAISSRVLFYRLKK